MVKMVDVISLVYKKIIIITKKKIENIEIKTCLDLKKISLIKTIIDS